MVAGIVGGKSDRNVTTAEGRRSEGGEVRGRDLTATGESKVSEPVDEGIIDLVLGKTGSDRGIGGTIDGEYFSILDREGGRTIGGSPTGIGCGEVDSDRTSTRIGGIESGQVGGVHDASTGESKLVDPVLEVGIDGCLRKTITQIDIGGAGDGDRRWLGYGKGSGAIGGITTSIVGREGDGDGSSTRVGRREGRQIGGIDITATGEGKLADPGIPGVVYVLLRGTERCIVIRRTGYGQR